MCVYSRDEVKQAEMRASINDQRVRYFIGCVRDPQRLRRAMEGCDVVVHAAALKRIEVGHYCPDEMVKTNIGGAMNVIDAAMSAGVYRVVALSTDKAFQPVSPYGQTKALAESLFLNANNMRGRSGPRFAVCRYGNIVNSRGSVIPKWRKRLLNAETIQITDPRCTRFWMRLDQAVQLVLDTAAAMPSAPAIPELPAYELGDLAEAMGVRDAEIIGLPAWEKRHESMDEGKCSETARRMTVDELREELLRV